MFLFVCVFVCVSMHSKPCSSMLPFCPPLSLCLSLSRSPSLSKCSFVRFRVFPSAEEKYWRIESRAGGMDLVDLNRVIPSFAIYPRLSHP